MSEYPLYKFGGRWICDGPEGRFQAKSKKEALALLAATGGRYADAGERERIAAQHSCRDGEMIEGRDGFLFHAESTDCVPDPWPTIAPR